MLEPELRRCSLQEPPCTPQVDPAWARNIGTFAFYSAVVSLWRKSSKACRAALCNPKEVPKKRLFSKCRKAIAGVAPKSLPDLFQIQDLHKYSTWGYGRTWFSRYYFKLPLCSSLSGPEMFPLVRLQFQVFFSGLLKKKYGVWLAGCGWSMSSVTRQFVSKIWFQHDRTPKPWFAIWSIHLRHREALAYSRKSVKKLLCTKRDPRPTVRGYVYQSHSNPNSGEVMVSSYGTTEAETSEIWTE
jgi:hypothetical protein